ncbi:MAG: DNA polymerase III subunit delta [Bacilli bacterium]|nr:DNA polymerase III subunit delta [Bacilli bacterium]
MILVLYSTDPQMARHVAMKQIRKDFPKRDEFNYISLNMELTPLDELAQECSFLPLGCDRKCVLAFGCSFLAKTKTKLDEKESRRLLEYLKNPDAFIDLYMLVEADAVDEKNPLVKAIMNTGQIKGIPLPKPEEWMEYAKQYFAAKGCGIEESACRELILRVDNDYGRFQNDLGKLSSYANGETITLNAVKMLIAPKIEEDTFAMSNALTRGDVAKAMAIYKDLKAHSVDEIRLINTLASQFLFMDEVRYLDLRGNSSDEIARELATSRKRVEVTLSNLYRIHQEAIPRILEELYECEKSILTGNVEPAFAFTRFLANYTIKKSD